MEDLSNSAKIVDIDDQATWPEDVVTFIEERSESINLNENSSMSIGDEILLPLLNTSYLLLYHATRLLPHEKEDILEHGLQMLTEELVAKKIREAVGYGYLTERIGEELLCGSTLRTRSEEERANRICFVVGKSPIEQEDPKLANLFDIWGGESINYTDFGKNHVSLLKRIGEPAVVKTLLPSTTRSPIVTSPELTVSFIEAFKGEDSSGELHLENESIPSTYILDILRPADMRIKK